jgi:uncharacterized cupin superfamily protein
MNDERLAPARFPAKLAFPLIPLKPRGVKTMRTTACWVAAFLLAAIVDGRAQNATGSTHRAALADLRERSEQTMKMIVRKAAEQEIEKEGMKKWPTWGCEASEFPWHYDRTETCYVLEGEVTVEAKGQSVTFGPGDIVVFPRGLDCVWKVKKAVRKHYQFSP